MSNKCDKLSNTDAIENRVVSDPCPGRSALEMLTLGVLDRDHVQSLFSNAAKQAREAAENGDMRGYFRVMKLVFRTARLELIERKLKLQARIAELEARSISTIPMAANDDYSAERYEYQNDKEFERWRKARGNNIG